MVKEDRKPEYHKKDRDIRLVSRANGLWAVQRFADRRPTDKRSEVDPWRDLIGAHALSYEQAKARMEAEAHG